MIDCKLMVFSAFCLLVLLLRRFVPPLPALAEEWTIFDEKVAVIAEIILVLCFLYYLTIEWDQVKRCFGGDYFHL